MSLRSRVQPGLLVYVGFISGLYQIKMRKLKHQSNYNAMPFASGRGKLNTRSLHSMAYFRAEVYHQRKKKHGKLKLSSALHVLLFHFGHDHQQHLSFSSSHSKFFLLDEKVI